MKTLSLLLSLLLLSISSFLTLFKCFANGSNLDLNLNLKSDSESSDLLLRGISQTRNHNDDQASCFPALGFKMPSEIPSYLDNWWCPYDTEYGFVGFGYEVEHCQSANELKKDFVDIRKRFNGRYVRLYGACDRTGFYDDVVDAAWDAGIGVFSLIWFGFKGTDEWIRRRDELFRSLHTNPKARFVTRAVQFGSEPLFDNAINGTYLLEEVNAAKKNLSKLDIPVTVSDLAYSFRDLRKDTGGPEVLASLDVIAAHILPYFAQNASIALKSWPNVQEDLDYFIQQGRRRKIWFTENGWPWEKGGNVEPNSPDAVADVKNQADYYKLLDKYCPYLKSVPGGGVGWFAHIYSIKMEPQYGILDEDGNLRIPFSPRTSC